LDSLLLRKGRRQKAEGRRQEAGGRRQEAEGRRQKARKEVRNSVSPVIATAKVIRTRGWQPLVHLPYLRLS